MALPNRYAKVCIDCKVAVPANAGMSEGPPQVPKWVTYCKSCWDLISAGRPRGTVAIDQIGPDIIFKPVGFLGPEAFSAFLAAIEGTRLVGGKTDGNSLDGYGPKINVTTIAKAIPMVEKLKAARFTVKGSKELAVAFKDFASGIQADVKEAVWRADVLDSELRARGLELFPFQRTGIEWLASRSGALLADSCGLGKSLEALLAIPYPAPVLIICPSVAKRVWEREIEKWRPEIRPRLLFGRESFEWPKSGEAVIANYDILPDLIEDDVGDDVGNDDGELLPALPGWIESTVPRGTVLIADEAHCLKEYQSQRSQRFSALSAIVRRAMGRVWLLTATPLLNYPPELWTVLSMAGIASEAFGSYKKFTSLFGGRKTNRETAGGDRYSVSTWSNPQPEVADRIRRVCLRRVRQDVLPELPEKMWREIQVDVDAVTKGLCDGAVASLLDQGIDIERADSIVRLTKLEVPEIGAISRARSALATVKIPTLLALLADYEAQSEPVVVFSAHRAPIDLLGERSGWKAITGDIKDDERSNIEEMFQEGRLLGLAATIQAGGVSITLTRACNVIFVDRLFTPLLNEQAEDRIARIGQKRGCLITSLVANHSLDKRLYEVLVRKQEMVTQSVDAARSPR